jgi:acetyl esterase/lipase
MLRRSVLKAFALALFAYSANTSTASAPAADVAADTPKATAGAATTSKTFVYKRTPKGDLEIEVFFPADWKASDHRPAIVFFFGGGWTNGKRSQFENQSKYLAGRGMVAATADYRIKSKHQSTPDQSVEDAKSAVRWMRSKAAELGIDPDKLAAGGGSAGGHLAASTALCPGLDADGEDKNISSKPNALVLFNPVVDITAASSYLSGTAEEKEKAAKAISPILYLDKQTPPAVFFFGTADRLAAQGKAYVDKAAAIGVRAELYTAEGMGHGFFNRTPWQDSTLRVADQFLTSLGYLKGDPTIAAPDAKATLKKEPASGK